MGLSRIFFAEGTKYPIMELNADYAPARFFVLKTTFGEERRQRFPFEKGATDTGRYLEISDKTCHTHYRI